MNVRLEPSMMYQYKDVPLVDNYNITTITIKDASIALQMPQFYTEVFVQLVLQIPIIMQPIKNVYHALIASFIIQLKENVSVQHQDHINKMIYVFLVLRQDSGMEQIVFHAHKHKFITH